MSDPDIYHDDSYCLIAIKEAGSNRGAVIDVMRMYCELSLKDVQRALADPSYFFASIHRREIGEIEGRFHQAGAALLIKADPDR